MNKYDNTLSSNILKEKIDLVFKDYFKIEDDIEDIIKTEQFNGEESTSKFKDHLNKKLKGVNKNRIYELEKVTRDILSGLQHRDLDKIEDKFLIKGKHITIMDVLDDKKGLNNTNEFKKRTIKSNDILLRIKGQIGPAVLITEKEQDMYYYNDLVRIRVDFDQIIPQYLCLYLNSYIGKYFLNKFSKSKSMNYINIGSVKEVPILTPMMIDQWKIVRNYFNRININKVEKID
ncbi:MAG TPA: hypothetical protein VJ907_08275 [Halanaerobiales bacterium]|nr:hypothetical protein [Halanaerobiales bacterium]